MAQNTQSKVPLLLLKTPSLPVDGYAEFFSTLDDSQYNPVFVPVLEHRFKQDTLDQVRLDIINASFISTPGRPAKYGAMIFTSQRAVEAVTQVVEDIRSEGVHLLDHLLPESVPFYVVGPATARGLRAMHLHCPILGEETGNGEALSLFILEHYNSLHQASPKPHLLFLVGDKRRDIIPKTLQSTELDPKRRSRVDEVVIYETGEMQSFKANFMSILQKNKAREVSTQWLVVFSPTGCKAMLESLDLLDNAGRLKSNADRGNIFVATIGPTTRDFLIEEFGFSPDVCASTPSAEGIADGIMSFIKEHNIRTRSRTNSSPKSDEKAAAAGSKRKADETVSAERETKAAKKQISIEESMGDGKKKATPENSEMEDAPNESSALSTEDEDEKVTEENTGEETAKAKTSKDSSKAEDGTAIEESSERKEKMPSNILEKGIIYFLTRNRVGLEDAESVGDLQRTFWVLRPMPIGAALGDGTLPDLENIRLMALPKKVFPKSHNDRFMTFVEKASTTMQDLKDNFFKGVEYDTKTMGTRKTEDVTFVGEGVYAITRSEDRTTHIAYSLTIPSELGEVQEDLGLKSQGSFIISVKNPERSSPANTRLPDPPKFPKEVIQEFRGLAWSEVKPNYLDYPNCQLLLIGEKVESATEPTTKDKKHDKETPKEELEQLEHENELRVEHLSGDDSIFHDLNISKKDYSKVPTTW
ncbi:tetrapyrrole biosynthesis, uroporphyrinogen III synthase [Pleomassaria siparia CBS 279.74]|uniref:Tetrapyrrole biosynthesis, uroporphyrinogen III synthase n=1 Tax=Pleomassaria siparia CBS 279.74 TaxID=1314801 RepID=A0A6G1KGU8_9PLEO|nr:tetrapyrrole biosynthesis, uroporphyrinogen III synthase [Pleomassaria siparia CBS 279.74]